MSLLSGAWLAQSNAAGGFSETITIGGIAGAVILFILSQFKRLLDEAREDRKALATVIEANTESKVKVEAALIALTEAFKGSGEQWRERA